MTRRGFTIVELLVVISIIAMLSAILLPAVNSARAAARQIQCINNMGQLAKAVSSYVATKDRFPNYVSGGSPVQRTGWVYALLPNLEKQPIRDEIDARRVASAQNEWPLTANNLGSSDYYISSLVCPDDTQKSVDPRLGPLSYGANAGVRDCHDASYDPPESVSSYCGDTGAADWRDNGVFGRSTEDINTSNNTPIWGNAYFAPALNVTRDYISSHDGNASTILFAENSRATSWTAAKIDNSTDERIDQFIDKQTVIWDVRGVSQVTVLNGRTDSPTTPINTVWYQQSPSSFHAGGFVVAYADGHVQFMSDVVEYQVYARAMTPNGPQARRPADRTAATRPLSYTFQSQPLAQRDLEP
jgi:prepilin-type N-terminal cleavage/methylation domain-containing protein/prepilin-type processing-associated H-X9-DG protein